MTELRHINRQDLVRRLALKHGGLDDAEVRNAIVVMLDSMITAVADGRRVEVRGFGSFDAKDRPASARRNPQTGELVKVPARRMPRFRAGRVLRRALNKKP